MDAAQASKGCWKGVRTANNDFFFDGRVFFRGPIGWPRNLESNPVLDDDSRSPGRFVHASCVRRSTEDTLAGTASTTQARFGPRHRSGSCKCQLKNNLRHRACCRRTRLVTCIAAGHVAVGDQVRGDVRTCGPARHLDKARQGTGRHMTCWMLLRVREHDFDSPKTARDGVYLTAATFNCIPIRVQLGRLVRSTRRHTTLPDQEL